MQDNYVGDIGDYGKYGLLRHVTAAGLRLAVNWYRVAPTRPGKQEDGKYISYSLQAEKYRHYDPELFDCLAGIVHGGERSIEQHRRDRGKRCAVSEILLRYPDSSRPIGLASSGSAWDGWRRSGVPRSGQRTGERKDAPDRISARKAHHLAGGQSLL